LGVFFADFFDLKTLFLHPIFAFVYTEFLHLVYTQFLHLFYTKIFFYTNVFIPNFEKIGAKKTNNGCKKR